MRTVPDPGFAGDDGAASPEVRAALSSYASDPDGLHAQTLTVLQYARLLVPVVAVPGEVEYDAHGLAHDKTSEMATVLMTGRDGRKALLAFTGSVSMQRWNPDARPVPVQVPKAAEAALQEEADAIVVDVAGPQVFVMEQDDLQELAKGRTLVEISGGYGWVKPAP
jgi:SseB protein N-terminal domain